MSVDQEQRIGSASEPIKPYTMGQLERNREYLKRLIVYYANGEPVPSLQEIAREFGHSPRKGRILQTVERVKETMQVEGPFDVLNKLGIDFAPLFSSRNRKN